jgi:hypothetical protein
MAGDLHGVEAGHAEAGDEEGSDRQPRCRAGEAESQGAEHEDRDAKLMTRAKWGGRAWA